MIKFCNTSVFSERVHMQSERLHNRLNAFTLTEILLTLGIIAIVAALTIPTLIHSVNTSKFQANLKKTVSTLSRSAMLAQAKYDTNYASIAADSNPDTCASGTLAGGSSTMCTLFNSTLSGFTFLGTYGSFLGNDETTPYTITTTTNGFSPSGYLLVALADGTIVGFKSNAKGCELGRDKLLSKDILTKIPTEDDKTGLANCIGFIDVNGSKPPNVEVNCLDGTSEFGVAPCRLKSGGGAISDVYLIVFHDSTVEPATNSSRAVMIYGKSIAAATSRSSAVNSDNSINIGADVNGWEDGGSINVGDDDDQQNPSNSDGNSNVPITVETDVDDWDDGGNIEVGAD